MKRFLLIAVLVGFFLISSLVAHSAMIDGANREKPDSPVKLEELQKERIASLVRIVAILEELNKTGTGGEKTVADIAKAQEELITAKLETTDKPDERVALLTEQLKNAQEVSDFVEKQHQAGIPSVSEIDYLRVKARSLNFEIKLLREKKPADPSKFEQLQKERNEACKKAKELLTKQQMVGPKGIDDIAPIQLKILEEQIEMTDQKEQRIALLEEQLKIAQDLANYIRKARDVGFRVSDLDYFKSQAACQAIEIKLLQEKPGDSAKLEQLQKERIEALGKVVELMGRQAAIGVGGVTLSDVAKAREKLINAKLEATDTPAKRIGLLKEELKIAQNLFDEVEKRSKVGFNVNELDVLRAKEHCLAVEIKLAKERAKVKPAE